MILQRINETITTHNRLRGGRAKVKFIFVGVKEANEIIGLCSSGRVRFLLGFDVLADIYGIATTDIEIVLKDTYLEIVYQVKCK